MIPGKVPHSTAQVGVYSEKEKLRLNTLISHWFGTMHANKRWVLVTRSDLKGRYLQISIIKHRGWQYSYLTRTACPTSTTTCNKTNLPVEFLLYGSGKLLVETFQVCEADEERVSLRANELLCVTKILQLTVSILKSLHKKTLLILSPSFMSIHFWVTLTNHRLY